jgi:threonine 3-dehydrogenase
MEASMRKKVTLITGVSGEVGLALVKILAESGYNNLLTLDIRPLPPEYTKHASHIQGDILDKSLLNRLVSEYDIDTIFHMAALLSTRAEFTPVAAHQVNVEGTMGLLQLAAEQSEWRGDPVMFLFPSSIAAYGIPDLETKSKFPHVKEWEWNYPITMYGCNKLYCEMLGTYFSEYYRQLAAERPQMLDFRCVRFPGLISASTQQHKVYHMQLLYDQIRKSPSWPCQTQLMLSSSSPQHQNKISAERFTTSPASASPPNNSVSK